MRRQLLRSDRSEIAGSTIEVAKRIAPARRLGLPLSSGPAKSAICVTRSPGAKRKLAVRMPTSSWPRMHPVWADVVFTHPNWTSLPSVRFTCSLTLHRQEACQREKACTQRKHGILRPLGKRRSWAPWLSASSGLEHCHAAGHAISVLIPCQLPAICQSILDAT